MTASVRPALRSFKLTRSSAFEAQMIRRIGALKAKNGMTCHSAESPAAVPDFLHPSVVFAGPVASALDAGQITRP